MDKKLRPVIAFAAGALINKKVPSSVFVHIDGCHQHMKLDIGDDNISIFNHATGSLTKGRFEDEKYRLYNNFLNCHLTLIIKGDSFEGFDYSSSTFYTGKITKEKEIRFFDYQANSSFNFTLFY